MSITLTRRQTEVLQLAADGLRTKQIARELWISEQTAQDYFKLVHQRLGVQSRPHAVAVAMRMGLIR